MRASRLGEITLSKRLGNKLLGNKRLGRLLLYAAVLALAGVIGKAEAQQWYPYEVDVWQGLSKDSARSTYEYSPLKKASKKWDICVSFPHMKDSYWLSVDYGVIAEARRLGVKLQLVEAGGYENLATQISQIEDCVSSGADAVAIGAISQDGLNNVIAEIRAKGIPVIDLVNGISAKDLSARSSVSFQEMGYKAGEYLAGLHPRGTKVVKVGWFPGPAGAAWVEVGNKGFIEAIKGSAIDLVETKYGDTGKEVQAKLVEDALEAHPDLDYIAGTAVTAEAAIVVLRSRGLLGKVKIVSYYYTPGVDQGIRRSQILAAPTDSAVIQGRVAIDQAVRILEGKDVKIHVGPKLFVVSQENLKDFDTASSLAPKGFKPTFKVN